ncbi:HDOD domain-containing protein [Modestobacter sp. VKM Ac-2985]|uniref:HDOD domain-containing protein n=1 Tax=Modestobacter sp. VKM Ac-2985 TaxID=3004139 RepID=UPI0022AB6F9B|nr:HDOD domain-containing protein [Modestobacter sp. VKM Ac-2985]MCZ2839451.1 HDOD domain-containing protein [Modestobacter sp. VKM Ac-2985]
MTPSAAPSLTVAPVFDLERVLGSIDSMAAQRPVAAQVVAETNSDRSSAAELSRLLGADVALAGRVMKLANSAFYGMRGRVTSLQFAVTVVGFGTVRTMATVALTDLDDESRLPEDFWEVSTTLALAASTLAPRFAERPQDALCLGLLAQMGVALLHHNDAEGYAELWTAHRSAVSRRTAEVQRYGISALRLTSVALEQWGFPAGMLLPLQQVDDEASFAGALLRSALEVAGRLTDGEHEETPIERVSCGQLRERDVAPLLAQVRTDAEELRAALLG